MNDLFQYPFLSEVWGTFADWAIVFVTFFTLLYLVKTFRAQAAALEIQQKTLDSQLIVQNLQLKTTTIENERFRKVNMPIFDIKVRDILTQHLDSVHKSVFSLELTLTNSFCRNFQLIFTSEDMSLAFKDEDEFACPYLPAGSEAQWQISATTSAEIYHSTGSILNIMVRYDDPVNNSYSQNTEIIFRGTGTETTYDEGPTLIQSE